MNLNINIKKYILTSVYAVAVLSGFIHDVMNFNNPRMVDYYSDPVGVCVNYVITDGSNTYASLFDKISSEGQLLLNNTGSGGNSIQCAPAASREIALPMDFPGQHEFFVLQNYVQLTIPTKPFASYGNIFRPPEYALSSGLFI